MPKKLWRNNKEVRWKCSVNINKKYVQEGGDCYIYGEWLWVFDEGNTLELIQGTYVKIYLLCPKVNGRNLEDAWKLYFNITGTNFISDSTHKYKALHKSIFPW